MRLIGRAGRITGGGLASLTVRSIVFLSLEGVVSPTESNTMAGVSVSRQSILRRTDMREIVRVASVSVLPLAFGVGVRGATKRALLSGINHYNPSAAESEVLKRITAEPHKSDSRFAPGYEWPDLSPAPPRTSSKRTCQHVLLLPPPEKRTDHLLNRPDTSCANNTVGRSP